MRFDRIETKLIILMAVPLIVLVAVSMFFVIYYVEGRMREDFQNKNNLELNSLAMIVAPLIYEYDFNAIERELDVIMKDKDVHYVIVMDETGTTIRSKGVDEPTATENLVEKETDILHQGEIVGRLKMRFSLLRIDQEIQKLELITVLLFISSFLVLVFLTYFFSRRLIIKPINELTDGVKHISKGDFDYQAPLKRKDELGELAASFNQMAKNLDKSHRALRESEERYALAQRAANIGSWDWDIRTGEIHWSETIESLFGFGRGEFGETYEAFLECVHSEDRQYVIDSVNACREDGKEYNIEHRIVWPDGTVRSVSEMGGVFRDENGKAIRMLGMVVDITERKRTEEALRKAQEELEAKVEERTKKLKEETEKLERMNKLFIDRELRMKGLKEEIKKVKKKM